jgi:hypothetical protein
MNISGLGAHRCLPARNPTRSVQETSSSNRTSISALAKSSETAGSLSITTDDGDKVTLSYSAMQQLAAAVMSTRNGETSARGAMVSSSKSVNAGVTVEGELDRQELGDILKLFKKFFLAIKDLGRNDTEKAAARMDRVGHLETISEFTYGLQYEESVAATTSQWA